MALLLWKDLEKTFYFAADDTSFAYAGRDSLMYDKKWKGEYDSFIPIYIDKTFYHSNEIKLYENAQ